MSPHNNRIRPNGSINVDEEMPLKQMTDESFLPERIIFGERLAHLEGVIKNNLTVFDCWDRFARHSCDGWNLSDRGHERAGHPI